MAEVSRVAADASLPVAAPTNSAATRSKSAPSNEDILLCVDVGVAELDEPWPSEAENPKAAPTRLDVVKQGLQHFIRHKSRFNKNHRFGLCVLTNEASWILDLTADIDMVLAMVNSLQVVPSSPGSETFEFDKLTALLTQKFSPCLSPPEDRSIDNGRESPNNTLIRTILIYGRSFEMPTLSSPEKLQNLLGHSCFIIDVLYCHKKLRKDEEAPVRPLVCQDAFDFFNDKFYCEDADNCEFIVEVGGSRSRFYQHIAMLLSNPLQRDDQETFLEKLESTSYSM